MGFLRYLQEVGFLRYLQGVNMFLPSGHKHYDPYVVNQLKSLNPRQGHLPTQLVSPPGVGPGHQQPFWIWVSVVTTVGVLDKHISDFSYLGTHLFISSEKPHQAGFFLVRLQCKSRTNRHIALIHPYLADLHLF